MSQRFEIELVTLFNEQGLDAAVAAMQQKLKSLRVPDVGGAGGTPTTGAGAKVDPAALKEFNAGRAKLEQLIAKAESEAKISEQAARNARNTLTSETTAFVKSTQGFITAVEKAEREAQQKLVRNTSDARSYAKQTYVDATRPQANASVTGKASGSNAADRALDKAEEISTDRTENGLAEATALLAAERRKLSADVQKIIAADADYVQASISLATERARLAAQESHGRRSNPEAINAEVEKRLQQTLSNAARDTQVNAQILHNDEALNQLGAQKLSAERRNLAIKEEANRIALQQNAGASVVQGGSFFQRAQASIAARQGGGTVDPSRFQTGGQFVASRAFTTAGFAVSGAALYGGVEALKSAVKETEELDAQFALLRQQFDAAGKSAQLPGFRAAMLQISRDTGITADQVVNIGFQLQGAFDDTTTAINNTAAAMKLVRISGLGIDEVTNDLTATASTYGVTFEQIGDEVVSLERRYGVLASETVNTFGQMSNTAHQAGLSFEQLGEIIGATSRVSGRSSTAIAESFNRILPAIQSNSAQIQQIYADALDGGRVDQGQFDKITKSLASGQSGKALLDILADYDKFNKPQQNQLQFILGGTKDSGTISPLVQQRSSILAGIQRGPEADSGALQQRFDSLAQTLQQRLDRIAERFRQLGVQLGEAGLLDALKLLAGGMLIVLDATTSVLDVFNRADDLFGGFPSKVVAIVLALKLLQVAIAGIKQIGGAAGGILGGRGNAAQQVAQAAEQAAAQRATLAATQTVGGTGPSSRAASGQGSLFNAASFDTVAVQRTLRSRISEVLTNAVSSARTAPSRFADAYRATGGSAGRQANLPGFSPFATTANTINTQVSTAGRGFATNVSTGLRTLGTRLRTQLAALGNLNARTYLPGGGGANGQAGGRISTFITGGGGLQGGITTAFSALAALGAVTQLVQQYSQTKNELSQQTKGLDQQLGTKSLDQLQALKAKGTFKDSFATGAGSALGLNDSLANTGNQAIGKATNREFEQAVNAGFLANDEANKKLLEQIKQSGGLGKAGDDARKKLGTLSPESKAKLAELSQSLGKADAEQQTSGDSNIADIESIQQQYELGSLSYTEYINKLRTNVDRLRELAANGDQKAKANYQKGLTQFVQQMGQLAQQQDQLFQQGLDAQGLTPQAQSQALQRRVAAGIPQAYKGVATPTFGANANSVATPTTGPEYNDPGSKTARFEQLNGLVVKNRALFDQAAQNVNDPATLEQLRKVFSLSPEQLAEYQDLARLLGRELGDTGELVIQAQQIEAAKDKALQLATTKAQATIAGLSDPAAIAKIQQDLANQQAQNASEITSDPNTRETAQANAALAKAQADRSARDQADAVASARLQAQGAAVSQDPVAAAKNQIAQANLAKSQARGNQAAQFAAQAQLIQAQQSLQDAQKQINESRINLFKAQHPEDVLAQAQAAQREADLAASNAHGEAARLDAQAQRIAADRQMQDAIRAVADSQSELLKAQFTASGELLKAAQEGLKEAQRALADAQSNGAGQEVINELKGNVITQKDAVRKQDVQDREDLIEFDLQMGNISKEAAIARYQAILPLLNTREQRDLLLKIHQLQQDAQSASDGLQFNLPTTLGLPTLYTARRLTQETGQDGRVYGSGAAAGGATTNNDNRVVTIQLNANGQFDGEAAVQTIVTALNEPPRYGQQPRLY